MSDFTHLHVHSHYSLLDGLGKIGALVERAKDMGMDALALTDHGVMYGVVDFYKTAREAGIKPIIGMEAYLAPTGRKNKRARVDANPRHLTLLAQNNTGYKNLIQLTTKAHLEGYYYKPRIDYDILEKHSEGVIVLSGCLNGDIAKAINEKRLEDAEKLIKWHREVFGPDRFYLEVQHHAAIEEQRVLNSALIKYSRKFKIPLVATTDAHYIHPEDAEAQDVLVCVQTGKTVQDKNRLCMLGEDFSLKTPEMMKEAWKDYPQAIESTQKIAEMCNVKLDFSRNHLPHFPLPKGQTAEQALREKCEIGLKNYYDQDKLKEAGERLDYELEVIGKTGYASYFLIVADFVNEAKKRGILVGPGRGSAAGSIVSFLLKITGLDPLHYNLLFERFLNPERVSMPDIDLDFADDRRDEMIDYVREKYGHEHVAQIITFGTMAARAAIRDAGRALGFPYSLCDQVAKTIPMFTNFEEALQVSPDLKQMYASDPQVKRLVDTAKKLEGVCRHASTHAAGVVVTEDPLTCHVPLQMSTTGQDEKALVTQYAMKDVEDLGLLKIDFLGLKNLTIIQNALRRIKERHGVKIDIDNLPLDDAASYRLLQEGKTTGVFQLESAGMKRYLKELKPTEFEDIISMVALYRPGPMDSIPDFIAAKHGRKMITYLHPKLKPILEKTYGVIVTQDQVLQMAREFAGLSYAEADILRKAVGKKIKKLLDEQREKFIAGAIMASQVDKNTAVKVWDFIEPFARYGFNRAHAACYAMIAYQTAYLKARYPADFMAAVLTSDEGNTDRQAIEVAEALSMNIAVLPPDINESEHDFTVVKQDDKTEAIRFGLSAIKNVGHNVVRALITERETNGKYIDLLDLFRRVSGRDFNRKSVESMAKCGAMDAVAERNLVLENLDDLLVFNRSIHKVVDAGQKGLFGGGEIELAPPKMNLREAPSAERKERLAWEKELLGLYLSEHPLSEWRDSLKRLTTPMAELPSLKGRASTVRVAGVVSRLKQIVTKKAQQMAFCQFEDLAGSVEVVVFPTVFEKTREYWEESAVLIVEGKLNDKDGDTKVLVDRVWQLNDENLVILEKELTPVNNEAAEHSTARILSIALPAGVSREQLEEIKGILAANHAPDGQGMGVRLLVANNGSRQAVATGFVLTRDEAAIKKLMGIVGDRAVSYK